MLHVTHHAVERFIKYWRPGMFWSEARECLEALVARSARTRRRSGSSSEARIHIAVSDEGERICFIVRRRTVVTVLAPHSYDARKLGVVLREHRATLAVVEAERARLAQRIESECATEKAAAIVTAFWHGASVKPKALRRARRVLGLPE